MLVIVLPALSAGLTLLLLDRQAGTHFFQPNEGGNALLSSTCSGSSGTPRST